MSNLPVGYNEPPDWDDYFEAQDDWIKDHVKELESQLAAALAKNAELKHLIKKTGMITKYHQAGMILMILSAIAVIWFVCLVL